ncbi:hypothetical protein VKT23_014748 [Stygiomarasmius scandens]|uniref:BED-type domain-containing protein n=1 Tax=Marasmiellus scandens TaxID=2682957 RepID=A0ABR1IZM1_9AGAR
MPAARNDKSFWEPIIGDRTRIKCTICAESDTNTSDGVMLKTSKISHVKTKAHKEAVRVLNTQSQNTASVAVSSTQNARYVTMNAWQTFFDNNSGSVNPDSTPEDPFDDVTMNEDIAPTLMALVTRFNCQQDWTLWHQQQG